MADIKHVSMMTKTSGTSLAFISEYQRTTHFAWLEQLPDKQLVSVTLHKHRPSKTHAQLGYWYRVILPFAVEELVKQGHNTLFDTSVCEFSVGVKTTTDTVDLLFKVLFSAHKQLETIPFKREMSDMQMGELIDFSIDWLLQSLGVIVPPPERL